MRVTEEEEGADGEAGRGRPAAVYNEKQLDMVLVIRPEGANRIREKGIQANSGKQDTSQELRGCKAPGTAESRSG